MLATKDGTVKKTASYVLYFAKHNMPRMPCLLEEQRKNTVSSTMPSFLFFPEQKRPHPVKDEASFPRRLL
jgi:hypothetical protein